MDSVDDRLRNAGRTKQHEARELVGSNRDFGIVGRRTSATRRLAILVTVAGAIVTVVALLALPGSRDVDRALPSETVDSPLGTAGASQSPTTQAVSVAPLPSSHRTTPSTEVDNRDDQPVSTIMRPGFGRDICAALSARNDGISSFVLSGRSSGQPVSVQVIAEPSAGPTGPFMMVHRWRGDGYEPTGSEVVETGQNEVHLALSGDNLIATWIVGDSLARVMARGFDRDELLDVIARLRTRPDTAEVPGFDLERGEPPIAVDIAAEDLVENVDGDIAVSQCREPTSGSPYRLAAINGDPILRYSAVLDRPVSIDAGVVADSLVVINGPAAAAAPELEQIVNLPIDGWSSLPLRPPAPANSISVTLGQAQQVELADFATPTASGGSLGILVSGDGELSVSVDTQSALVHPDAQGWAVVVDGRRSYTSYAPGGAQVLGTVLLGGIGEFPLDIEVATVDGAGLALQTTGTVSVGLER